MLFQAYKMMTGKGRRTNPSKSCQAISKNIFCLKIHSGKCLLEATTKNVSFNLLLSVAYSLEKAWRTIIYNSQLSYSPNC